MRAHECAKIQQDGCVNTTKSWWRHQMETFSAWLAICAGNSPVPGEFPTQRPVTRSFDVFFDLRPNKQRLSTQSWGWLLKTLSHPLWRHRNDFGGDLSLENKCVIDSLLIAMQLRLMLSEKWEPGKFRKYRKISYMRRTKIQNLYESRLVWQLFLPNPLKPGVKSKMKM